MLEKLESRAELHTRVYTVIWPAIPGTSARSALASAASLTYMDQAPPRREGAARQRPFPNSPRSRWDERAAKVAAARVAHQGGGEARRGDRGIVPCQRSAGL